MRSNAPEINEEIKVFDAVDYFQNQDYGNKQKADEAILSALYKYDQSKKVSRYQICCNKTGKYLAMRMFVQCKGYTLTDLAYVIKYIEIFNIILII